MPRAARSDTQVTPCDTLHFMTANLRQEVPAPLLVRYVDYSPLGYKLASAAQTLTDARYNRPRARFVGLSSSSFFPRTAWVEYLYSMPVDQCQVNFGTK